MYESAPLSTDKLVGLIALKVWITHTSTRKADKTPKNESRMSPTVESNLISVRIGRCLPDALSLNKIF